MNLLCIGGGNMATALIGGLLKSKAALRRIHVIEPDPQAQERLRLRFTPDTHASGIDFSVHERDCPMAFLNDAEHTWALLAIKPQHMRDACEKADANVRKLLGQCKLLSIAAGIPMASIQSWCGGNPKMVRAMPNTPALVAQGITGLVAADTLDDIARAQAEQLMRAVGQTIWVADESLMDAVTALSGSGPAYVFRFIEALSAAGEEMGLTPKDAAALTMQTLKGAMALLESSGESPKSLREKVTSKGGTTEAALASLDQDRFMAIIAKALQSARDRGAEMSKEFSR